MMIDSSKPPTGRDPLTGAWVDEYSCLDCEFETDDVDLMNDHIDEFHNDGYGQ